MDYLNKLHPLIMDCKNGDAIWDILTSHSKAGIDETDITIGLYWFACDYYCGMNDPLYSILCEIGHYYDPGRMCNGPQEDSAEEIVYTDLGSVYFPNFVIQNED